MKRLSGKKKYLGTILSSHAPPKDSQHFPQKSYKKADSNISTPKLRSTHDKANN